MSAFDTILNVEDLKKGNINKKLDLLDYAGGMMSESAPM